MDPQPAGRYRALFILSLCIVLLITTWFSATAVIPKLQSIWNLAPTLSACLTIGVQLGFVIGAIGSSIISLSDIVSSKKLMINGSIGAAAANLNNWQWVFLILIPGPLIGTCAMLVLRRMPEAIKIANGNR
jgi:hypothetical protein